MSEKMSEEPGGLPSHVTDAMVTRILDRAIEIDAQCRSLSSLDNIRAVARELGVSDQALEQAIRECARESRHAVQDGSRGSAGAAARRGMTQWLRSRLRAAIPLGLIGGAMMGALAARGGVDRESGLLALSLTACAVGVACGLRPLRKSTFLDSVGASVGFWTAFLAGTLPFSLWNPRDILEGFALILLFLSGSISVALGIDLYVHLSDSPESQDSREGVRLVDAGTSGER
jgi:hypothetical protein